MLTSIKLDNQATLHTTEIGDNRWNRVLTAKCCSSALPAAQAVPQPTLGIGLITATSVCGQPRHAWLFPRCSPPHPAPLPRMRGRGNDRLPETRIRHRLSAAESYTSCSATGNRSPASSSRSALNRCATNVPSRTNKRSTGEAYTKQQYDVTADGQRFLVNAVVQDAAPASFTVVLNWAAALSRR